MFRLFINNEEYTDYIASNPEISGQFVEDTIIGNTPSLALNLTLDNTDKVFDSLLDFPFVVKDEEKDVGVFYVVEAPERMTNQMYLEMYDCMSLTDIRYESELQYPTTLRDQLDEMSRILNIPIDYSAIPQDMVTRKVGMYDNTLSIRNHLSMIAEAYACNVYAKETGGLIFKKVSSKTKHHITENDVEMFDRETLEEFTISKVTFDDSVLLLEAGTNEKNTLYLTQDNMYIDDQETVDYIYSVVNGLSVYSAQDLKIAAVNDLKLGDIVEFDGYFRYMALDFKTIYLNGEYNIQEMSGRINTKNLETMQTNVPSDVKIRRLKVLVDQNDATLKIIAQEQEGLTNKMSELEVDLEGIDLKVESATENIYKFEVGSGNIFENCRNYLQKDSTETGVKQKSDMPLGINADYLRGKDIVISVDINVRHAIIGNLGNYIGAEFDVFYKDGTRKTYSTKWYLGQYLMQYLIQTDVASNDERLWTHFKIDDKEVASTSNLRMIIAFDCEYAMVSNPKVEFGKTPTSFLYDMDSIRDNITTIQKEYTEISTKVSELNLKAVSMEEQITTINGEVDKVTTRLQSAEIKLQPTNIVMAINEKIGADGKLYTTKFTLDKTGVHIKGGGLDITNNSGTKVFYADTSGNLVINNLTATNGKFSGAITSSSISGSTINIASNFTVDSNGNVAIKKGTLNINNKFVVDSAGKLKATGAEISGTVSSSTLKGNTISGGTISGADIIGGNIRVTSDLYIGNNLFLGEQSSSQSSYYKKFMFTANNGIISSKNQNAGYDQIVLQSGDIATLDAGDHMVGSSYNATVSCVYGAISLYAGADITANKQIKVSSDRRLKKDIEDIDLTSILKDVCVKSFRYRDGNTLATGVIAQDLEDNPLRHYVLSYPELIGIRPNKKRKRRYAVNYQTIFLAAVQEVQKLRKEINELRMEVKENEN